MKKLFLTILILIGCLLMSTDECAGATATQITVEQQQQEIKENSIASVDVPTVSYFQERRTIAKWAQRWDKPNLPCFVYLFSFGNLIGYYVTDGKPASTMSYLVPEETAIRADLGESYGEMLISAPDIDGTYGTNNPGIRFFTAEGTAVEWAGSGASYLYSDAPLPLDCRKLN